MGEPKPQDTNTWALVTIAVSVIGCLGVIVAALIGLMPEFLKASSSNQPTSTAVIAPTTLSTQNLVDTPTHPPVPTIYTSLTPEIIVLTPSPQPNITVIPFADPANPKNLNPIFGWQPGSAIESAYDLELNPGELTLITGAHTDQWQQTTSLPLVIYPIKGNFEAQVRVQCNPIKNYQFAGIGIRSTENVHSWARTHLAYFKNRLIGASDHRNGQQSFAVDIPYSGDSVYLKVSRYKSLATFSYSANGVNWVVLAKNIVVELPEDVEIYLFVFSSQNNSGFIAQFKDFSVIQK